MIKEHNAQPDISFEMGINQFADLSEEEMKKMHGLKFDDVLPQDNLLDTSKIALTQTAPTSVDWLAANR